MPGAIIHAQTRRHDRGACGRADLLALPGLTQDGVHYSATGSAIARDIVGARLAATFI